MCETACIQQIQSLLDSILNFERADCLAESRQVRSLEIDLLDCFKAPRSKYLKLPMHENFPKFLVRQKRQRSYGLV